MRGKAKSTAKAKASEANKAEAPAKAATSAKAAAIDDQAKVSDDDQSASTTQPTGTKPKRIGALAAAAQVLAKVGKPMRAKELIAAMAEQRLWKSPHGKTPHATLYAAMMREARDKGTAARFRKVDRGQFAING